ncbi:hypothetical protein ABZU75_24835 [Streptosporangium sp. NPDC005286]|uniref:hypothetical protein n=1 Tax=Streptosporangium sp. NPDC005286 TaxID=3154463 RepID=UPI0033A16118
MRMFALPEPRRTQRRPVLALAVAVLTIGAQGAAAPAAHAAPLATANAVEGTPQGNVVIEWNRTLLNLTIADATIGVYNAKYHYRFWRPITAIRSAAGNPRIKPDPAWTPLTRAEHRRSP